MQTRYRYLEPPRIRLIYFAYCNVGEGWDIIRQNHKVVDSCDIFQALKIVLIFFFQFGYNLRQI